MAHEQRNLRDDKTFQEAQPMLDISYRFCRRDPLSKSRGRNNGTDY